MRPYEAMVVLQPTLDQSALEALIQRLTDTITNEEGEVTHVDQWGKRRLAYEVDGHIEGFYVVIKFNGNPGITNELEHVLRISDAVLRFLVILEDEPFVPTQPTADAEADVASEAEGEAAEEPVSADTETEAEAETPETDAEATPVADAPATETAADAPAQED